ncbi:MAG: hypothetical protein VXZ83_05245 [Verrucomicrobiota bacterium]|nr:hypothetical protein [Verrucomicrobiota bacterium]
MPREKKILFGFATQRFGVDGRVNISICWGRLLASVFLVGILGWISMAGAFYFHFKYNKEFSEVSFYKMLTLLPFGLADHRVEMGNYHIKKGLVQLEEENYRDAIRLLRLGVSRAPSNLQGRRVLAEFYELALKNQDFAANQLIKGLDLGGIEDLDYLKHTLGLLLRYQMDEAIQNIADKYLPEEPDLNDINRTLAFGAANANYLRGNYDRADDYLINYQLVEAIDGILLSAQISWDRGNRIAALSKLEQSIIRFPGSEPLLVKLSRYYRELGDIDKARRYAMLRNVTNPLSAAPRVELLYIYEKSGETKLVKRESLRMLKQFRDDESALQALANFAAETGYIDLARRTYEESLENEFKIDVFALLLIEAHLVEKDFQGALKFSEELLKERPDWVTKKWGIFNALRAVASYGMGRPDLGEIYLKDFLDEQSRQGTYVAVAKRFTSINQNQQASKILTIAHQRSPTSQAILSELIRAKLTIGHTDKLYDLISRYLLMRRPDTDLLSEAYRKLGSDRFIFAQNRDSLLLQLGALLRERSQITPTLAL